MKVELDENAVEDLAYWSEHDLKKVRRIIGLIREITRTPFSGTGKPEPLRHSLAGYWSRRIDREHRLVYRCGQGVVHILSCRYHYHP